MPFTLDLYGGDPQVLKDRCLSCKKDVSRCRGDCFDGLTKEYIAQLERNYQDELPRANI